MPMPAMTQDFGRNNHCLFLCLRLDATVSRQLTIYRQYDGQMDNLLSENVTRAFRSGE